LYFERAMAFLFGANWWQHPHEDLVICRYIAEHFPMMVDGCVVPAYARVRDKGVAGSLAGAL